MAVAEHGTLHVCGFYFFLGLGGGVCVCVCVYVHGAVFFWLLRFVGRRRGGGRKVRFLKRRVVKRRGRRGKGVEKGG